MSERESNAIADINESIFMYVLEGTKRQNLPPHNVLMFFPPLHLRSIFAWDWKTEKGKNLNSFTAAATREFNSYVWQINTA